MIPIQVAYTEYQRAEQPIADLITHILLVLQKIASPFVLEYRQWVVFYGPNKNTALPVAVNKRFAEFATHCGTDTSINAIPDFVNSFYSLTKIGFNSSSGDDESLFFMISLGQV